MKLSIEIRPGEGGKDAQLLVSTVADMYRSYCSRSDIKYSVISDGLN
jgi:protein subunit release factor A